MTDSPTESPSIYLGVCGKFHAFALAREYSALGRLGGLYAADQHFQPPAGVPSGRYFNRWEIKYWRLLSARVPISLGHSYRRENALFDTWLTRKLERLPGGIFHGWNTHVSKTLTRLDPARWLRCIERSCPHNLFQHELLTEESRRLELPYSASEEDLARAVQELYDTDVIVAPSRYSAGTYDDPVLKAKVRINPLGANYPYREKVRVANTPLCVLLVGNAFLRKGTHYLVEAFKQIDDPRAELWIRGEVPPQYRSRITDSRVKIFPSVTLDRLHQLYREATVFCLPSIDEGFGMVGLEALSFGLPVVYTEHCGTGDLLNDSVGRRVPIRSPERLAEAILEFQDWNAGQFANFDEERKRLLQTTSWRDCAKRMIEKVYVHR